MASAPGYELSLRTADHDVAVFDLDTVLAGARQLQARAWKQTLDRFFLSRACGADAQLPFSIEIEYNAHCHGRPRHECLTYILASRGIQLPNGTSDDPPSSDSIHALGNLKYQNLLSLLDYDRGPLRDNAFELVRELRAAGLRTAVVSPGDSCLLMLAAAGGLELFEAKLDGEDAERWSLAPKPAPDTLARIADQLGARPGRCVAVGDSPAGVCAARRAGYGLVVALNRNGALRTEMLSEQGAHRVVEDTDRLSPFSPRPGTALRAKR